MNSPDSQAVEYDAPDGTTYPWAQDLDGTWHLRPVDDEWGDPETEIQAHGRCGTAFGSVHVSTERPIPEPDLDERLCTECSVVYSSGQTR